MSDHAFPADIYAEPSGFDIDTLKNLGPLRPMAPFHHTDRNTLARIGAPTPNPLARAIDDATRRATLKTP